MDVRAQPDQHMDVTHACDVQAAQADAQQLLEGGVGAPAAKKAKSDEKPDAEAKSESEAESESEEDSDSESGSEDDSDEVPFASLCASLWWISPTRKHMQLMWVQH